MKIEIDQNVIDKANIWLTGAYDEETKQAVRDMMENNPKELTEAFYRDLEFGTGGLRGIMGAGSNRMNKYTVGMATQGFSNYLKINFPDKNQISIAIAHDSRNNSRNFAEVAANIFTANGIKVFLFDDLRPTPELSFAIRHLSCQGGIMITASHNPKEYNGYKAYWEDGGQLISPHDKNVIAEVEKIGSIDEISFTGNPALIETIGEEVDKVYLEKVKALSLSPEVVERQKNLSIVYTPLHGTGIKLVPDSLKNFGFTNVHIVEQQAVPDGDFPTVVSPNPEEPAALELAIRKAKTINADLVMATDPDGDSLVYELFMPYHGATQFDPMPQPPYAPPYPNIQWLNPYSTNDMMGGVPLAIDPQTGELSCTPGSLGQFVVGIKVKEYRNGQFISETKRDFQFNVVNCPNLTVASIYSPVIVCGSYTAQFTNTSMNAATYFWNFGDGATLADTSNIFNPSYTYPDTGTYTLMLIAYSGINPACNDTS